MNSNVATYNKTDIPILMGIHELQQMGFSRSTAYTLLNRKDIPRVVIGGRKFINRDLFFEWLDRGGDIAKDTQIGGES